MRSLCCTEGVGCTLASDGFSFHIKEVLLAAMMLFRSLKLLFLMCVCVFVCLFVFRAKVDTLGTIALEESFNFRGETKV